MFNFLCKEHKALFALCSFNLIASLPISMKNVFITV